MATALQIIQQAAGEMGLEVPQSVAGTQSADGLQMFALLNAVGSELVRQYPWSNLIKTHKFTTEYVVFDAFVTNGSTSIELSGTGSPDYVYPGVGWTVRGTGVQPDTIITQQVTSITYILDRPIVIDESNPVSSLTFCKTTYPMPDYFDRAIARTHWDKSRHWEMVGPLTPQEWAFLNSGLIATSPRVRWRMLGRNIEIWPPMANNECLGFEYLSDQWVYLPWGAYGNFLQHDEDVCLFPTRLMVLGLKMKYFQVKGFDDSIFKADYIREFELSKATDGGGLKTLSFAPQISSTLIGWNQIPDSGYGGV